MLVEAEAAAEGRDQHTFKLCMCDVHVVKRWVKIDTGCLFFTSTPYKVKEWKTYI